MKKIILFFALFSSVAFGQTTVGEYEVKFNGWLRGANNHHCGEAFVNLQFSNSAPQRLITLGYYEDSPTQYVTNHTVRYSANNIPTSMYFSASRRIKSSCNGDRPNNKGTVYSSNRFNCYNLDFEFGQFQGPGSDGNGLWNSNFNIKVYPLLSITTPSGYLPTENLLVLNSHTGFAVNEYNWEYSLNPGPTNASWTPLPQYYTNPSISVNAFDILGPNAENYLGQKIYFRQTACNRTVSSTNNPSFIILKSAPKILSKLITETLCYDSNDGTATIKFNRQLLLPNESMNIIVKKKSPIGLFELAMPTLMNPVFDIDNNLILTNLEAGEYQLTINGFYNGNVTYSPHTELGGIPYGFIVEKPDPVDFTLIKQDIWCYEGNNGTITINATGEDPNYLYSLDDGTNWIPFSNGNTHTITNLVPNIYNIKVKDGRGCIAKIQQNIGGEIVLSDVHKVLSQTITQPLAPVSVTYNFR
jgi:hypothetical protein